ncbi:MAG TPA: hypothetical protein VLI46_03595 [Ramlibacter sp.]|nr:hypothetical protein [Ramlibacter sp.]
MHCIRHFRLLALAPLLGPPTLLAQGAVTQPPPTVPFQSALAGYQPFADDKPIPWRQANDTVREVGGWRAYSREAAASAPAQAPDAGQGPGSGEGHGPGHGHPTPRRGQP